MTARAFAGLVVTMALSASCGSSPTEPTSPPSSSSTGSTAGAAEAALASVVAQASSQVVLLPPTGGPGPIAVTMSCPNGGSMTMTMMYSPLPPLGSPVVLSRSSQMEYRSCNHSGMVINSEPYLQMTSEYSFTADAGGLPTASSGTMRTTGALRYEQSSVQSRAVFDCTRVYTITYPPAGGGLPQITSQSTGTITWEQPIGSAAVTRSCGPV